MRASGQAIFHSGRLSVLLMALPLVLFLVLTVLPVLLLMPFLMALFGLFMASKGVRQWLAHRERQRIERVRTQLIASLATW
ncbi:hypothetical protein [Gloeobacter morelensis]|uniref:Uncharacterized protein n=1 Tax=Gloeobacter morelensis MG652769 TaxID=2781736 RepID=A0ABY3PNS1_9CYAN|nr:hypothetical protein [Gloeobacter morelensis]UFP95274.1 hypothetical protein ISF26_03215 [Gloeobacter morelensis MG652769]